MDGNIVATFQSNRFSKPSYEYIMYSLGTVFEFAKLQFRPNRSIITVINSVAVYANWAADAGIDCSHPV